MRSCAVQQRAEKDRRDRGRWSGFYAQQHSAAPLCLTRGHSPGVSPPSLILLRSGLNTVPSPLFLVWDLHLTESAHRMDAFIIAALALCSLTAPACGDKGAGKARSCSDIRQFYSGKGFSLDGVPQSEISGKLSKHTAWTHTHTQSAAH